MAGDFADIPFIAAIGDGGLRSQTQMVVIHATDNTASDEAEASYATHRPDQISAHFYSDEDSVIQAVPLSHVAYGCYPTGNSRSVQFELVGLSNQLSGATLRRIAPIVRRVCDRYGIPIRHVGPADLRAGAKGICGHGDVTLAWGEGSHTDPGTSFPWITFIGYINGSGENMYEQYDRDRVENASRNSFTILAAVTALRSVVDALAAAITKGGGTVDTAAILAGVDERLAALDVRETAELRDAVADLGEGGAAQVRADA